MMPKKIEEESTSTKTKDAEVHELLDSIVKQDWPGGQIFYIKGSGTRSKCLVKRKAEISAKL